MSKMTPHVSILMLTFNNASYVAEQIDSILAQTYTKWDLVITDDASTDQTLDVIKEYEKSYKQIHIISSKINKGIVANFKSGLPHLKGELIALCDGDDFWHPRKLEWQVEAIDERLDRLLVYCDSEIVDSSLERMGQNFQHRVRNDENILEHDPLPELLEKNYIPAHTMLFRRELLEEIKLLPLNAGVMHDHWTALLAACSEGIYYVSTPLVLYRQHDSNAIGISLRGWRYYFFNFWSREFGLRFASNSRRYQVTLSLLRSLTTKSKSKISIEKKVIELSTLCEIIGLPQPQSFLYGVKTLSKMHISRDSNQFSRLFFFMAYKANPLKFK